MNTSRWEDDRERGSLKGFDPEDDGAVGEASEFFDFKEGGLELTKGAFVKEEDHFNEFGVGVIGVDGGVGSGDPDLVRSEDGRDVSDDPGLVFDRETDVVGGDAGVDFEELPFFVAGEEAPVGTGVAGGFGKIGDDRGCGGALAGAATVEEGVAQLVAFDRDGIENAIHGGEDVLLGEEGGLGADFDGAIVLLENEREEFHDVTEFGGETDVEGRHFFDPANVNVAIIDEEAVGEGAEEDGFVGGIPAVDVEGFVGFGVSELLRFLEGFGVGEPSLGHALKDVVGGAVDNTGDGNDAVSDEGFLQGLDDGDASGDGCFEVNRGVVFLGESEKVGATLGEKGFISGHDRFSGLKGGRDEVEGGVGSADELDHDIDGRIIDDLHEIGGEELGWSLDLTWFVEVADCDFPDFQLNRALGTGPDELAILLNDFPNARANGAESR